jgi:diacylglycerol diphosphate phosphatase/phosphatidate phosphatase
MIAWWRKGYDCLGGALTGSLCAWIAFRKTWGSVFDFRFNHVLLPRKFPLHPHSRMVLNRFSESGSTSLFHRHASQGVLSKFNYSIQESVMHRPFTNEGTSSLSLGLRSGSG